MIVSPSQAERWMICPTLWDLSRRWEAKGEWDPRLSVGSAVHLGIARWLVKDGDPQTAMNELLQQEYRENKDYTLPQLIKVATRLLAALQDNPGLTKGETVVSVETPIPEYGDCIPDLVTTLPTGTLVVTDFKTSMKLSKEWATQRLENLWPDYQLLHNAHAVSKTYGSQVGYVRRVLVVDGTPKASVYTRAIPISPALMARWFMDAQVIGNEIKTFGEAISVGAMPYYPRNLTSCNGRRLGRCPMWSLCWELDGDESGAEALYTRKEDKSAIR